MSEYIKDDNNKPTTQRDKITKHTNKFKIEPFVLGMFWNDRKQETKNILQAIKDNKPYNEYELLTDEEKKAFDSGQLVF